MTPTITWLEKVRKLPAGHKAEAVAAAHNVARLRTKAAGEPYALQCLYYDEDTWRRAYELAAAKRGDR